MKMAHTLVRLWVMMLGETVGETDGVAVAVDTFGDIVGLDVVGE